jgi:hypothetical protein
MYDHLPLNRPLTKKELDDLEKDRLAEADLSLLLEAAKIRRTPERLSAALAKRAKMQDELERIAPGATKGTT